MGAEVPISGAEEFALELLQAAEEKASALASADQPPVPIFVGFPNSSPPEGLIDAHATVIELVLKHRLACEWMRANDTRERREIESKIKTFGHDAASVFEELSESTQKAIRDIYDECNREYDDFASSYGTMADLEQMLAWVKCGPAYRYTTAIPKCRVPIVRYWSPPGTSEVKELPTFPDALVNWASEEFKGIKPERTRRQTIEALLESAERPKS